VILLAASRLTLIDSHAQPSSRGDRVSYRFIAATDAATTAQQYLEANEAVCVLEFVLFVLANG